MTRRGLSERCTVAPQDGARDRAAAEGRGDRGRVGGVDTNPAVDDADDTPDSRSGDCELTTGTETAGGDVTGASPEETGAPTRAANEGLPGGVTRLFLAGELKFVDEERLWPKSDEAYKRANAEARTQNTHTESKTHVSVNIIANAHSTTSRRVPRSHPGRTIASPVETCAKTAGSAVDERRMLHATEMR